MNVRAIVARLYTDRWAYFFITPAYIAFAVLMFLPVLYAIGLSFFETNYVTFEWVGPGNFVRLFNDSGFQKAFKNTLIYVIVITPGTILISLTIAFLVFPLSSKLQSFFRGAFYLPGVIGGVVLSLVWLWMFNPVFGLLNFILNQFGAESVLWLASPNTSKIAVIMVVLTYTIGQPTILFLAGLGGIPTEILDAALVDGANRLQSIRHITLPLLQPVLMFVLATTIIGTFQIWETVYLLTAGGPAKSSTSIVYLLFQTAFLKSRFGLASAMGVVLMILIIPITLIIFRMWRETFLE